MKRYIIPPSILLLLWFVLNIIRLRGYILWVQGNVNTSIQTIIWILFLITIFIEVLYMLAIYKKKSLLIVLVFMGAAISGSMWLEINSTTTIYYYEEDNHQILVVNRDRIAFGDITFYNKDNFIFSNEFASCGQSLSVRCDFYIDDNNLIIETFYNGDLEERIILIPID